MRLTLPRKACAWIARRDVVRPRRGRRRDRLPGGTLRPSAGPLVEAPSASPPRVRPELGTVGLAEARSGVASRGPHEPPAGLFHRLGRVGTIGVLLALTCVGWSARAQRGGEGFTTAERRALRGGELVRRPVTRSEGPFRYVGGTSYVRVREPRARVFAQVLDTSAYPRLIPAVVEARLIRENGDRRIVFLRHQLSFVSASYHARVTIERDAHTVRFDLDRSRPHDVRAGRGFLTVSPYRGDESIVTWGVMADPGSAILRGVFGGVIADWILKVPWCLRARVEARDEGC